jgi:hypothetical protein
MKYDPLSPVTKLGLIGDISMEATLTIICNIIEFARKIQ